MVKQKRAPDIAGALGCFVALLGLLALGDLLVHLAGELRPEAFVLRRLGAIAIVALGALEILAFLVGLPAVAFGILDRLDLVLGRGFTVAGFVLAGRVLAAAVGLVLLVFALALVVGCLWLA